MDWMENTLLSDEREVARQATSASDATGRKSHRCAGGICMDLDLRMDLDLDIG